MTEAESRRYAFIPYTYGLIACGFSLGVVGVFTSTVSAGPVAVAGELKVTVWLPLTPVNPVMVLVAVTVTEAGAGYGVV